jgi:transposase
MLLDLAAINIFVRPGYTDMRKAINGLSVMVQDHMNEDPLSGSLYLFCNRQRRIMKALYWDRNGFCLWQKRLEKHRFPWPVTEEAARKISTEQLKMLLSGIDFWHEHTALKYSKVS